MQWIILILLSALLVASVFCQKIALDVNDASSVSAAMFAIKELSKLSDSGIYETLELNKIVKAEKEDGIFHVNTYLDMEIRSSYYKSGNDVERFKIIVMDHKLDHVKSFAIDEFPSMDESAIEQFWIKKVELKRKQREEAYRRLEVEALMLKNAEYKIKYEREDITVILVDIDNAISGDTESQITNHEARQAYYKSIYDNKASITLYDEIELLLSKYSLTELYLITLDPTNENTLVSNLLHSISTSNRFVIPPLTNDYIAYKSQLILDQAMKELF